MSPHFLLASLWLQGCPATGPTASPSTPIPVADGSTALPPAEVVFSELYGTTDALIGSVVRVAWTQVGLGTMHVEYSYDEDVWRSTPDRQLGDGPHEELLLGVPYDSLVRWRLIAEDEAGTTIGPEVGTVTDPPPEGLPEITTLVANPALWDAVGAPFLFTTVAQPEDFSQPWWILIVDRQGRVVWSTRSAPARISMHSRVSPNGTSLLIDQNSFWSIFDRGERSEVWELTIDGAVQHVFATPGLHHPFTGLADGSIAYGATDGFYATEQIAIARRDGSIEPLFDCEEWLDSMKIWDFCGSNGLTYDERSDTYLFTLWSLESVLQIDARSGDPVRWFGHIPGAWPFEPMSSVFWNPHGALFTANGTILLTSDLTTNGVETVVREYAIDQVRDDLVQVWSAAVGDGIYGVEMGEAVRLANGNTWHNFGDLPRLREYTKDGNVVWDVKFSGTAIGHTSPLPDLYALAPDRP